MQAGLSQPGSTWYVLKLSSMSTIMREWSALHAVQDLRFKDVLLSATTSTSRRTSKLMVPQVECSCVCFALPKSALACSHTLMLVYVLLGDKLHGAPSCVKFFCGLVVTMCN